MTIIKFERRSRRRLSADARRKLEASLVDRLRGAQKRDRKRNSPWPHFVGPLVVGGVLLIGMGAELGPPLVGCTVKGNISRYTGERIYHVPGQQYYDDTRIDLLKGERWFCSEEAARAAGWRKAGR